VHQFSQLGHRRRFWPRGANALAELNFPVAFLSWLFIESDGRFSLARSPVRDTTPADEFLDCAGDVHDPKTAFQFKPELFPTH
jgi:hypothetical protein